LGASINQTATFFHRNGNYLFAPIES
jgi:hypothetical protein